MSFYAMAFLGVASLGSLLAGTLASNRHIGATRVAELGGSVCLVAALLFACRLPALRRSSSIRSIGVSGSCRT